jgi:hypothetical protein
VRLVDYVAPANSTVAEQKWFEVDFAGSRSVAGRADSRSAESAHCVCRVRSEYVGNFTDITERLDIFAVPGVVCVFVLKLNGLSEVLVS